MEDDEGSACAGPDERGLAVASGDATKLAELALVWSGSKPERALAIARECVSLLETEVAFSAAGFSSPPPPPIMPGSARNSCLEALIVALNETCDGKSWYTSTKQLQLASLDFCIACRTFPTAHLNFSEETPRRLLAAADAPPPHPKRSCWTRVPRLRARRVTWNMPTAAELRTPIFAMADVDHLEFGMHFEGGLEAVAWPQHLKTIQFHDQSGFNQPLELVQWPASLQKISFGEDFDQPMEHVEFPASMRQLIFSTFSCFNQSIAGAILPVSLQLLALGEYFNQPIEEVLWPGSLQQLTFGSWFDQPIEGVSWPDSLQTLGFGEMFNQPVDNVRWPSSLQDLRFGSLDEEGDNGGMTMFSDFNQRIDHSIWPTSLRRLTLGHNFSQSLQGLGTWMPNLEVLRLLDYNMSDVSDSGDNNLLCGIEWPKGLRHLMLFEGKVLEEVVVPKTVQVVWSRNKYFRQCPP
ncbi:unnamed protein product [Ectocarpus fasciculatus]